VGGNVLFWADDLSWQIEISGASPMPTTIYKLLGYVNCSYDNLIDSISVVR